MKALVSGDKIQQYLFFLFNWHTTSFLYKDILMGGAVQYRTTVCTFLIMLTLHQATATTHSAMNRQPKGTLFNEDTFQPIIDLQLRTAFWAFLFPSFRFK